MLNRGNICGLKAAIFSVWCTLLLHTFSVSAVTLSDPSFYKHYPYILILEDGEQPPVIDDEWFFDTAASITFPVSVSQLPDNAPLLDELRTTVIPQVNGDSLQLLRIVMRGAASPEGTTDNNRRLGRERVLSLLTFLSEYLDFPMADDILSIDTHIEDYRSLCLLMRRASDPDYAEVQALCDRFLPNETTRLKNTLRSIHGGRLWLRLLNDYFPQLRTARFVIILRKYRPTVPPPPPTTVIDIPTGKDEAAAVVDGTKPPVAPVIDSPGIAPVVVTGPVWEPAWEPLPDTLPRRELLSVKTNLLFYAAYIPGYDRWCPIPNIAVEYYPLRGHFTFGASFDMPWWQNYRKHKYFQLRNYQVETRYYLRPTHLHRYAAPPGTRPRGGASPAFSGFYLQAYAHGGLFGICFDANRGWVGEGFGGGLGLGYVTPISRNGHWRLEFQLQAGFFRCKYDPYKYENPINPAYHDDLYYYKWTGKPELFRERQYRWNWFGPTRIGVTLSYDLLYRPNHKKGASFKPTEKNNDNEENNDDKQ